MSYELSPRKADFHTLQVSRTVLTPWTPTVSARFVILSAAACVEARPKTTSSPFSKTGVVQASCSTLAEPEPTTIGISAAATTKATTPSLFPPALTADTAIRSRRRRDQRTVSGHF